MTDYVCSFVIFRAVFWLVSQPRAALRLPLGKRPSAYAALHDVGIFLLHFYDLVAIIFTKNITIEKMKIRGIIAFLDNLRFLYGMIKT